MALLFSILVSAVGADSPEALFEQANAAYGKGAYSEAATIYERLISDGVHDPVVFINLGNAYYMREGWACRGQQRKGTSAGADFDAPDEPDNARNARTDLAPRAFWLEQPAFWHAAGAARRLRVALVSCVFSGRYFHPRAEPLCIRAPPDRDCIGPSPLGSPMGKGASSRTRGCQYGTCSRAIRHW